MKKPTQQQIKLYTKIQKDAVNLKRDLEIIYAKFGMDGHKQLTCKKIAIKFKISMSRMFQIIQGFKKDVKYK